MRLGLVCIDWKQSVTLQQLPVGSEPNMLDKDRKTEGGNW